MKLTGLDRSGMDWAEVAWDWSGVEWRLSSVVTHHLVLQKFINEEIRLSNDPPKK